MDPTGHPLAVLEAALLQVFERAVERGGGGDRQAEFQALKDRRRIGPDVAGNRAKLDCEEDPHDRRAAG